MANERLRSALTDAGVTAEELATVVEVDAKTVQRWLGGRTPYSRHRAKIARALATDERTLWPEAEPAPQTEQERSEIVSSHARGDDPDAPDWHAMLEAASTRIDMLDTTLLHVVQTSGVIDLLAAKARGGCTIRIKISDRDSVHLTVAEAEQGKDIALTDLPDLARDVDLALGHLERLLDTQRIEIRSFVAERYNSILRIDDQMLVTLHLWGAAGPGAPLLHLRRDGEHGLFAAFAEHYDAIWQHATDPVEADPDAYPDPSHDPDAEGSDP